MPQTFQRVRLTWLAYLLLAFYGYFLNILGPITPFLKQELKLSYTVASLHFTAFAAGILLVGLFGHLVIRRIGNWNALWLGALGMSVSALVLVFGRSVLVTVGASFCMGLVGSLILAIIPSVLSERHGDLRAVALSEANVIASLVASLAPLLVGWSASLPDGSRNGSGTLWRLAVGGMAFAPLLMRLWFGRRAAPHPAPPPAGPAAARSPLPRLFWVYWLALVLAVSVEFCMIFWSADYLEISLGLAKVNAAQSVSLFLGAMIVGRLAGSRLVQRFSTRRVVIVSILVAAGGFGLFWMAPAAIFGLVGLFLTGLGVAGLYPLILALSIGVARSDTVQASARATLASGTAILLLPLVLGRLADMVGIRLAYGVVGILLAGIFLIMLVTRRRVSTVLQA